MTIGKKLFSCFGALLALALIVGIYALVSVSSLGNSMGKLVNVSAKKQYMAGDINAATSNLVAFERGILLRAYMNEKAEMEQFNQKRRVIADHINGALVEYAALAEDPQVKQLIAEAQSLMQKEEPLHNEIWQLANSGKLEAAIAINKTQLAPTIQRVSDIGQKLSDGEVPVMAKAYAGAIESISWIRWIMFFVMGLCLAIGAVVIWVVRNISASLRKIVTELSNGGDQVASASGEIASTSQSLAQGSSEQAASLEEISASMEQMTAMAKRNSENSGEATGMMNETAKQVDRSNSALGEMVASMEAIKTSSERVAKIIKTIDEIAFQTNILALNAAVEAARAGEAGMGFAVVADEVRNLAQRSAVAAKDTAGLIEEAISNSNQGAERLDRVAVAIRAITESASRVKSLVQEVSESSKQQTIGINQTSTAVTQVSKVTQSAAASAEESAAASEELSAQAQTMRDLVLSLSGMVDGRGNPSVSRSSRIITTTRRRHPVTLSKPLANSSAHSTLAKAEEDPFPMDTTEVGNFRSF